MENVKKKMAELCEAVAAKGGNVIIIGDVKGTELQATICQMQGKGRALAMDMARIAHRKDGEPIRGIMEAANMMLEITEKVTEAAAAADAEVTNETTEEE